MCPGVSEPGSVSFLVQILGDPVSTSTIVVKGEDQLYHSRLLFHRYINAVLNAVSYGEAFLDSLQIVLEPVG